MNEVVVAELSSQPGERLVRTGRTGRGVTIGRDERDGMSRSRAFCGEGAKREEDLSLEGVSLVHRTREASSELLNRRHV